MITYLPVIIYCLLFATITWHRFHWGLILFFALLPTYLIRFQIGPLPTTLLEVMIWLLTIIWLLKYHKTIISSLLNIIKNNYGYTLFIATALFLLAATISVFTSIDLRAALGEWKAFYVEPILIFLILITTIKKDKKITNALIYALVLSGLVTSLLAIYQHFTGWLVPYSFWQNRNTFRVTAWYGFPNAVGLFLTPLIPLAMYLIKESFIDLKKTNFKFKIWNYKFFIDSLLFVPCSILAIIFAKNTGALSGALIGIFLILSYYKKTRWWTIGTTLAGIIVIILIITQTNFLKSDIALKNYSGSLRINMWAETSLFLQDHPLTGAGIASYAKLIYPYRIDKKIEVFHHPHNILLTTWVNLGLLGLFAFVWIIISFFRIGFIEIKNKKFKIKKYNIFVLSSMIVILIMGLIDSPYIKNDLAVLFWLLPALLLISQNYELEKS